MIERTDMDAALAYLGLVSFRYSTRGMCTSNMFARRLCSMAWFRSCFPSWTGSSSSSSSKGAQGQRARALQAQKAQQLALRTLLLLLPAARTLPCCVCWRWMC